MLLYFSCIRLVFVSCALLRLALSSPGVLHYSRYGSTIFLYLIHSTVSNKNRQRCSFPSEIKHSKEVLSN